MKLIDFNDYPHIHCDGMGDMQIVNGLARFLQFRWQKIDGVWSPVVVASIAIPAALSSPIDVVEPRIQQALLAVPGERSRDMVH